MPERAGALAVDEEDSGFADGRLEPGAHPGTGASDARVGDAVVQRRGAVEDAGWWSDRCAAVDLEIGRRSGCGLEIEVAGIDGLAGVVDGVGAGDPVGEGGFGLGLAG